jgi:hypothetical protein
MLFILCSLVSSSLSDYISAIAELQVPLGHYASISVIPCQHWRALIIDYLFTAFHLHRRHADFALYLP